MNILRRLTLCLAGLMLAVLAANRAIALNAPSPEPDFVYAILDPVSVTLYRTNAEGRVPVRIGTTNRRDYGRAKFTYSPDGRWLYYQDKTLANRSLDLYRMAVYSENVQRITMDAEEEEFLAFSPDAAWLYYVRYNADYSDFHLLRSRPGGSHTEMVFDGQGLPFGYLGWSDDGQWLLLYSRVEDQIVRINIDNGPPEQLSHLPGEKLPLHSPARGDWRYLYHYDCSALYRVSTDGGLTQQIETPEALSLVPILHLSPDGKWLVIIYGGQGDLSLRVWVYRVDGPVPVLAYQPSVVMFDSSADALIWTMDRSWLLLKGADMRENVSGYQVIFRVDLSNGQTQLITPDFTDTHLHGITSDKEQILVDGVLRDDSNSGQYRTLYRVRVEPDANGNYAFQELVQKQSSPWFRMWSPDGEWAYFTAMTSSGRAAFRMNVASGQQERLRDLPGGFYFIGWVPEVEPLPWQRDRLLLGALLMTISGLIKRFPIPRR